MSFRKQRSTRKKGAPEPLMKNGVLPQGVQMAPAVRQGILWKRAQGISKMGRTNWKKRFFTLHVGMLRYYDGQNPGQAGTVCKGLITIPSIRGVEIANDAFGRGNLFQVIHKDATLYCQADTVDARDAWIEALRSMCTMNPNMVPKYCPGYFTNKHWTCCNSTDKDFQGCTATTPLKGPCADTGTCMGTAWCLIVSSSELLWNYV